MNSFAASVVIVFAVHRLTLVISIGPSVRRFEDCQPWRISNPSIYSTAVDAGVIGLRWHGHSECDIWRNQQTSTSFASFIG